MAEPRILRFKEQPVVDRGTGVKTHPLVTNRIGSEHLTTGITVFEPGAKIATHWHNCDESVVILEGDAIAEIDGQHFAVTQYDTSFVPANVPHRFINQSDKRVAILWTYGSGHVTRTFADTGVTVEHLSDSDKATAPTRS